jgi:hypothetical protein
MRRDASWRILPSPRRPCQGDQKPKPGDGSENRTTISGGVRLFVGHARVRCTRIYAPAYRSEARLFDEKSGPVVPRTMRIVSSRGRLLDQSWSKTTAISFFISLMAGAAIYNCSRNLNFNIGWHRTGDGCLGWAQNSVHSPRECVVRGSGASRPPTPQRRSHTMWHIRRNARERARLATSRDLCE